MCAVLVKPSSFLTGQLLYVHDGLGFSVLSQQFYLFVTSFITFPIIGFLELLKLVFRVMNPLS